VSFAGAGAGTACELNVHLMGERSSLLKKYLDGEMQLELQALYSLQHLMHRLEHPNSELTSSLEHGVMTNVVSFQNCCIRSSNVSTTAT